ncbi:MAG: exo-beta-N-acetylmuramidase NamZ family protein, partial [Chitinophagaceae bacterium]
MKQFLSLFITLLFIFPSQGQQVIPGAERLDVYVPMLKGKKVAIFANQTSMVGNTHLVDTLRSLGIDIRVIFGPEHGFRGVADAGEKIGNYKDEKTGIPVVSLYGQKRRPSADDLSHVDIMIFDIQDVGVRFYTFISSLEEYMETAFELGKPLLLLDRPNPNGHYVDGPVLDKKYRSFIGMQQVPVVYGMTIAEYAFMIAGEKWLSPKANERFDWYQKANNSADTPFHFQVIKCKNYTHNTPYNLPIKPSPNLPDMASIYWYPSTCFFEGTVLSEGRGTPTPFQVFGHPSLPKNLYSFT